ncbi:MAG: nuclear transport factor 2 family protein [Actinobacteria bacterium]|nr:nuclear transport factor 2 family protein [Actinomycetota bacterium]
MSSADEGAIRALVVAYAELLDAGDLDSVAGLFEHGEFHSGHQGTVRRGRDEVRRMYDAVVLYDDGTPRTKHVLGNLVVDIDRDCASATASCTFTVMQAAPGAALQPVLAGRYVDRFARDRSDGPWHFAVRTVYPELMGDLSTHMGRR